MLFISACNNQMQKANYIGSRKKNSVLLLLITIHRNWIPHLGFIYLRETPVNIASIRFIIYIVNLLYFRF